MGGILEVTQLTVGRLAVCAYIVADNTSHRAALIDPAFETKDILALVKEKKLKVTHLINTHHHSDHVAGNAAIIRETGALLCIGNKDAPRLNTLLNRGVSRVLGGAGSPRPDILLKQGDTIGVGNASLSVIETPGHTAGGICLLGENNLFTGDTLFVGNVGRTDLPGGDARQLLASIRQRLYTLPDDTIVWPGHDYGPAPYSTIGREKALNPFTQKA
ncbi:MAG: MBL fold metallo-hydrolase [Desulfatibacillaceae bacterium]|nr:MBL fold metallo-hydrolase [Desulfatibacillaceae bacterium]